MSSYDEPLREAMYEKILECNPDLDPTNKIHADFISLLVSEKLEGLEIDTENMEY